MLEYTESRLPFTQVEIIILVRYQSLASSLYDIGEQASHIVGLHPARCWGVRDNQMWASVVSAI